MANTTKGRRRVQFTLKAPGAGEVFLAGDFNDWCKTRHPLKPDSDGRWSVALLLAPGRYESKYIVDGCWAVDPGNERKSQNTFGTWNNVLIVSKAK